MWDQRGAGLSRRHPAESYTLDLYVEGLDALIGIVTAESVVKEVTLVGHSWGGQYATLYTTRHPERVRRLVLSEPGPFTGAIFAEIAPAVMGVDPTTAFANELVWSELFLTADDHARADLRHALIALNGVANGYHFSETDPFPFWRMGAAASQGVLAQAVDENGDYAFDFTQGLERFTPEVLFIRGSLNEIHDLGYHQREMALYPNPTLVTLDGHGHDFIWTAAEAHLSAIRAYLAR